MIRSYQTLLNRLFVAIDSAIVAIAFLLAWYLKFRTQWFADSVDSLKPETYFILGGAMIPVFLLSNGMFGLYSSQRTRPLRKEIKQLFKSTGCALLIIMSLLFFVKEAHVSREMLGMFIVMVYVLSLLERALLRMFLSRIRAKGYNRKFMLIIGAGVLGRKVLKLMREDHREFGFQVIGFLDDRLYPATEQVDEVQVLGTIDDLERILSEQLIDQVVIALPIDAHHRLSHIIPTCEKIGVQTMIIPDYFNYLPAKPRFEEVGGIPMIDVRQVPLDDMMNAFLKRTFDILFSLAVLLFLSPLFLVLAIGVKLSSPGPVFFVQERVGKNRRLFKMYKFRTMAVSESSVSDTQWTTKDDRRKTKLGAWLRKTSLDELPQFYNVLIGDMSIIGPRPERPFFVDQFKEDIPKYMVKHRVRPGITGWAQVHGWRGDTSIEERIKCDIEYIENWSFALDLRIVIKTVVNGFINKNAY
jgi:Undecaprenyl-phosphate glucose phosphotransferase